MKKPRFFYSEVLAENLPNFLYCAARRSPSSVLRQKFRRAERYQPEHEPERGDARKREKGAVYDRVSGAEKEQNVEPREREYAGAESVTDQEDATGESRDLHAGSMCRFRGFIPRIRGYFPEPACRRTPVP